MALPTDRDARKAVPVWSGAIAYFPDAIVAIAELSFRANEQHNPGEPLHWAKEKSTDEADAGMRHAIEPLLIGGSPYDSDGAAHLVKKAWRACAELQRWLAAGNPAFAPRTPLGEALARAGRKAVDYLIDQHTEVGATNCTFCRGPRDSIAPASCITPEQHAKPPAQPDETLYSTKPLLDGLMKCAATHNGQRCILSDGHPTDHKFPPAVHCVQCGAESPMHYAGCLSHAANGGK